VGILDLGAFAEEGIGFVEEEDGVAGLGGAKNGAEVFLGLPDVLADHVREIDLVQVQTQFAGEHLSRHRLPCAARAGEKHIHASAESQPAPEAPIVLHPSSMLHGETNLAQLLLARAGSTRSLHS